MRWPPVRLRRTTWVRMSRELASSRLIFHTDCRNSATRSQSQRFQKDGNPMIRPALALCCAATLLSSCQRSEDGLQSKAENSAKVPAFAALGLTELQLLNADVYGREKVELGEVENLKRGPDGKVTGLVVEIEDSDPDRYVLLPLDALVTMGQGHNIDLRADMTKEAFLALPEVELPPSPFRGNS